MGLGACIRPRKYIVSHTICAERPLETPQARIGIDKREIAPVAHKLQRRRSWEVVAVRRSTTHRQTVSHYAMRAGRLWRYAINDHCSLATELTREAASLLASCATAARHVERTVYRPHLHLVCHLVPQSQTAEQRLAHPGGSAVHREPPFSRVRLLREERTHGGRTVWRHNFKVNQQRGGSGRGGGKAKGRVVAKTAKPVRT